MFASPPEYERHLQPSPRAVEPPVYFPKESITEGCLENLLTFKKEFWKKLVTELTLTSAADAYTNGDTVTGFVTLQNNSALSVPFRFFSVMLVGSVHLKHGTAERFLRLVDWEASSSADIDPHTNEDKREGEWHLDFPPDRILSPYSKYKRYFTFTFPQTTPAPEPQTGETLLFRHEALPPSALVTLTSHKPQSLVSYAVQTHLVINIGHQELRLRGFAQEEIRFTPRPTATATTCPTSLGKFISECQRRMDTEVEKQKRVWLRQHPVDPERSVGIGNAVSASSSTSMRSLEPVSKATYSSAIAPSFPIGTPPHYESVTGPSHQTYSSVSHHTSGTVMKKTTDTFRLSATLKQPIRVWHSGGQVTVPLSLRLEKLGHFGIDPDEIISMAAHLVSVNVLAQDATHKLPLGSLSGADLYNNNGRTILEAKRTMTETLLPVLLSDKSIQQQQFDGGYVSGDVTRDILREIDAVLNLNLVNRQPYPGYVQVSRLWKGDWVRKSTTDEPDQSKYSFKKSITATLTFEARSAWRRGSADERGANEPLTPSFHTNLAAMLYVVRVDVKLSSKVTVTLHIPVEVV